MKIEIRVAGDTEEGLAQVHDNIRRNVRNVEMPMHEAVALNQLLTAPIRFADIDADIYMLVDVMKGIVPAIRAGKKIEAIKQLRVQLACSLRAGKALVDLFMDHDWSKYDR